MWEVVTTTVLQDSARAAMESRVQDEEDQQQQQAGYYFEGFRKAVYMYQEVVYNCVFITLTAGYCSCHHGFSHNSCDIR